VHVGPNFWQQAPLFLRLSHLPARTATQLLPRAYAKEAKTRALSGCFISYEINAEAQYSKGKELPIPPFQTVIQTSFPPFSVPPILLWSSFDPNGALQAHLPIVRLFDLQSLGILVTSGRWELLEYQVRALCLKTTRTSKTLELCWQTSSGAIIGAIYLGTPTTKSLFSWVTNPKSKPKKCYSTCHIKSCGTCMEY
jgi:hypothetical protein